MRIGLSVFSNSLDDPEFISHLSSRIFGETLQISTKVHGGFDICTFELKCNLTEAWQWYWGRLSSHRKLIVCDTGLFRLFEGRLEGVSFTPRGVRLEFWGYGIAATQDEYFTTAGTTLEDTVEEICDPADSLTIIPRILDESCPSLSSDWSNLAANSTFASFHIPHSERPLDLISKYCGLSDPVDTNPFYFAVWEDRVPYYQKLDRSEVDWILIRQFAILGTFMPTVAWSESYNKGRVQYTLPEIGETKQEPPASWEEVTDWWMPIDRYIIIPAGEMMPNDAINLIASAMPYRKTPRQSFNLSVGPYILSKTGLVVPSYHIRAGDVIDINDLMPTHAQLELVDTDAVRAVVKATNWSPSGVMQVTPDILPEVEATLLAEYGMGAF